MSGAIVHGDRAAEAAAAAASADGDIGAVAQRGDRAEAAIAAAAADRLGEEAGRIHAIGRDGAPGRHVDRARIAAGAAAPADRHRRQGAERRRDRKAAVAAAAADRLRENAGRMVAVGADRRRGRQRRVAGVAQHENSAAVAAGAAAAAVARAERQRERADRDRTAAIAAAAADRLRENARRPYRGRAVGSRLDIAGVRHPDGSAVGAVAAAAAGREQAGRRAAVAAAAADRLRHDARRMRGRRRQCARVVYVDGACDRCARAIAAERDEAGRGRAVAAAAADRLRLDRAGEGAVRGHIACIGDADGPARAADAALGAESDERDGIAGVAAAAAQRLGEDADRPIAHGLDRRAGDDDRRAGVAAARAVARVRKEQAEAVGAAAAAAAGAARLDAVGVPAERRDGGSRCGIGLRDAAPAGVVAAVRRTAEEAAAAAVAAGAALAEGADADLVVGQRRDPAALEGDDHVAAEAALAAVAAVARGAGGVAAVAAAAADAGRGDAPEPDSMKRQQRQAAVGAVVAAAAAVNGAARTLRALIALRDEGDRPRDHLAARVDVERHGGRGLARRSVRRNRRIGRNVDAGRAGVGRARIEHDSGARHDGALPFDAAFVVAGAAVKARIGVVAGERDRRQPLRQGIDVQLVDAVRKIEGDDSVLRRAGQIARAIHRRPRLDAGGGCRRGVQNGKRQCRGQDK